jgi:hypothetical protein
LWPSSSCCPHRRRLCRRRCLLPLIVVCMSLSLIMSSPRSPPRPSTSRHLLIVDLIRCRQ